MTNHRNWKSVYLTSSEENTWVEAYHESTVFDANAEPFAQLPDGTYTLRIAASNDGPSRAEQSISYKFRLDTTAPVISELIYSGKDEGFVVTFDVTDDSPLAAVDLHDPADGLWFYRHVFTENEGSVGPDGRYVYHVEIPLSVIEQAWTLRGLPDRPAQRQPGHVQLVHGYCGRPLDEGLGRMVVPVCQRQGLPPGRLVHHQRP